MAIYALGDHEPQIANSAYVHPDAVIIGDVILEEGSSVWPCAVIRGDNSPIRIGARSSIQDGTVVHCTASLLTIVGTDCTVGHNVYLEGCEIEDGCLIGSSASVLNGARIGTGSIVGAGAVVKENAIVPPGVIVAGVPAIERGPVSEESAARIKRAAKHYVSYAQRFQNELRRID